MSDESERVVRHALAAVLATSEVGTVIPDLPGFAHALGARVVADIEPIIRDEVEAEWRDRGDPSWSLFDLTVAAAVAERVREMIREHGTGESEPDEGRVWAMAAALGDIPPDDLCGDADYIPGALVAALDAYDEAVRAAGGDVS